MVPYAFPFLYFFLCFPSQSLAMNPETIMYSYCMDVMAAGALFERDQTTWITKTRQRLFLSLSY